MTEYQDTNYIDKIHFKELAQKAPKEVISRTSCQYNTKTRAYEINILGSELRIYPHEMKIEKDKNHENHENNFHPFLELFAVHYLLSFQNIKITNHLRSDLRSEQASDLKSDLRSKLISEKDMPGGPTFFRGPHAIPTYLISDKFGNDPQGFIKRCSEFKAKPLKLADSSFSIDITPDISVAVLLWLGDQEFPAGARLLFDKTITEHFALDIIFALAYGLCDYIGK